MKTELTITIVAPDVLNPAPYNPRTWSDEEKEKLKDSLKRFGFVDPLIVNQHPDRLNVLIGGHFRLAVAKELGLTEVPVVYLTLPEEKERELNIRLNKNTGRFDFELLKDFDLELLLDIGFGEAELGAMWDLSFTTEDGRTAAKDENGAIVPRVKTGEVWQLGDHRLICGDSTEPETLKLLMRGEQAAMLYSDPPYNIAFDYSSGLTTKGKYGGSYVDTKSGADYREFLKKSLANGMAHAAKDIHVFSWNDQNHIGLLQGLYPELGITSKRVVFWLKNNFNMTPGVAFNKAVEPCVYGVRGKPFLKKGEENLHEILNRDIATGSRAFDDIWDYMELWLDKRKAGTEYLHPTEKPVTLHERPLRRCTRPGDIVLDLFAGSGSLRADETQGLPG